MNKVLVGIDYTTCVFKGIISKWFLLQPYLCPLVAMLKCHRAQSLPFCIYCFVDFIHLYDFIHHPYSNSSQVSISRPDFFPELQVCQTVI